MLIHVILRFHTLYNWNWLLRKFPIMPTHNSNWCPPSFPIKALPLVPTLISTNNFSWCQASMPTHNSKPHFKVTHNSNWCPPSFTINTHPRRERWEVWCCLNLSTFITLINVISRFHTLELWVGVNIKWHFPVYSKNYNIRDNREIRVHLR